MNRSSRRDPRAPLWDALTATDRALTFTSGRTFHSYATDPLLRSAVEREVEVVGAALARLAAIDRDLAARVPDRREIVDFGDVLGHRYWGLDDRIVWSIATDTLPDLRQHLQALLDELNAE